MPAFNFCHYCGTQYSQVSTFPRICSNDACKREVWDSPNVVGVGIVPMGDGLLGGVRGIQGYGYGKKALMGGFSEKGESIEETCAREILEESGIKLDPNKFYQFYSAPTPGGQILSFCIYDGSVDESLLATAVPCTETLEVLKLSFDDELAFPLHEEAVKRYQTYMAQQSIPFPANLFTQIQDLINGVDVDLDSLSSNKDE
jgi:ADP-ribose pyrophosphatase YjhB (NUDIX family)